MPGKQGKVAKKGAKKQCQAMTTGKQRCKRSITVDYLCGQHDKLEAKTFIYHHDKKNRGLYLGKSNRQIRFLVDVSTKDGSGYKKGDLVVIDRSNRVVEKYTKASKIDRNQLMIKNITKLDKKDLNRLTKKK